MNNKLKISLVVFILTGIIVCSALLWSNSADGDDVYSDISKNLKDLGEIYKKVSVLYVDRVDPAKFMKAGIDGMLNTLDPYTQYIDKEDQQQLQILTKGKYQGVGLLLNFRNNIVTVADPPFLGTPAARAGIREGDEIILVDSVSTQKIGFTKTVGMIRGLSGTEVTLTVRRKGEQINLEFTLIRENIRVEDVRYAGYIKKGIGYILLTRFSKNSGPEVTDAILSMKNQNLEGLILDLRSNPGGMLGSAVEVSDLFLKKNQLVVSTRGRTKQSVQKFKSRKDPVYESGPLVILVDRFSASASEIVAGAIQDHDRGIVIGDTTFGKGLVQTVVMLSPTSALKITTAKYFTPSGRCIQNRDYSFWSDTLDVKKSNAFLTDSGRPVQGGGGIAPDVYISPSFINGFVADIRRKSLFFNFAVNYTNTNEIEDSTFVVDSSILDAFKNYLKLKSFKYQHPLESGLDKLKTEAIKFDYGDSIIKDVERLEETIDQLKENMFQGSVKDIKKLLKRELASKSFGLKKGVEISIADDPVIQKAIEYISDRAEYENILGLN